MFRNTYMSKAYLNFKHQIYLVTLLQSLSNRRFYGNRGVIYIAPCPVWDDLNRFRRVGSRYEKRRPVAVEFRGRNPIEDQSQVRFVVHFLRCVTLLVLGHFTRTPASDDLRFNTMFMCEI